MQLLTQHIISVSGDYQITTVSPRSFTVSPGVTVRFFESYEIGQPMEREVIIGTGAVCSFFGILKNRSDWKMHTVQMDKGSRLNVCLAVAAKNAAKTKVDLLTEVGGTDNKAEVKMVSLVASGASIDINGVVSLLSGARRAEGMIHQENIFLDTTGTLRGVPGLLVKSNDVKASHSARTERLSDARLFYLRSRGIPKDIARTMMLRDVVSGIFSSLENEAKEAFLQDLMPFITEESL